MKFLIIDDDIDFRELVVHHLHKEYPHAEITVISQKHEFDAAIDHGSFDVVITDYDNPGLDGFEVLRQTRNRYPYLPVIMLTASGNEEIAVEGMKLGLNDYVTKHHLVRLPVAIETSINASQLQKKHDDTIDLLKASEERFNAFMYHAPAACFILDESNYIIYANKSFETLFHTTIDEIRGKSVFDVLPPEITNNLRYYDRDAPVTDKITAADEIVLTHKGVSYYWMLLKFPITCVGGKKYTGVVAVDITERKHTEEERQRLREQLYHTQKMDSIGNFAGSVAHDFNNTLMTIVGYGNLLLDELKNNPSAINYIQTILKTAMRAADLTKGLLTFSRKQPYILNVVDINKTIQYTTDILRRLLREDTQIVTKLTGKNCLVMADGGQLEQVIMNLAVNARDAMPKGGILTFRTEVVEINDTFIRLYGFGSTGSYALIVVSDTGIGMDEITKARIFEPFFTTKEVGKGTGLGLTIVYGIIKQHKGYLDVESKPGKGTIFSIYLPLFQEKPVKESKQELPVKATGGTETLLIAEDDEDIGRLLKTIFEIAGYKVITASNGSEAIEKFMENEDRIKLLLLDVMMPVKNGLQAFLEIQKVKPDIKVLFLTGYDRDTILGETLIKKDIEILMKPIIPADIVRKVREVLDKAQDEM